MSSESADTVALRAAYGIANQFSWTREELEVYDYWDMKAQDERGRLEFALKANNNIPPGKCSPKDIQEMRFAN